MEEKMSYEEAMKIALKNETVEVKPVVIERPFFKPGHDGEFMYTGCNRTYTLPYSNDTRSFVRIFDSAKEQEAFEVLFDKPRGSLNLNNRENEFWTRLKVDVSKEGKLLDLSIPGHMLEYKILKANTKRVSEDWASRHRPGIEFALVNAVQIQEDDSKKAKITELAMDLFTKLRKSNSKMFNVLRLLDKTPPKEAIDNTQFLKTEILKVIDQKEISRNGSIKNINDFIKVVEDPLFDTKVLIYDAMDANEISLRNGMFKLVATDAVIGNSIEQSARWLDDLVNQESKIILQQRLKK